jgi:peptidoglycan-associated lipoprotein
MLRKKSASVLCSVTLGLGLVFTGCSSDENAVQEPVSSTVESTPAQPPQDAAQAPAEVIYFGFDLSQITPAGEGQLQKVAEYMRAKPSVSVKVEGHCDERGTVEYNLALGERRAQAVRDYLVNLGIESSRLSTISYGKEHPVEQGHTEAAFSKNRRAQFVFSN